jgi:glycogen operon protein
MLLMGDEVGRTQQGNNNTYCHDNALNWFDWSLLEKNAEIFNFCQRLIAFRKAHPVVRHPHHAGQRDQEGRCLEVSWHGTRPWQADWGAGNRTLAMISRFEDDVIYVAFNAFWDPLPFGLPAPGDGRAWRLFADTSMAAPGDVCEPGKETCLDDQGQFLVGGRSVVILVAR